MRGRVLGVDADGSGVVVSDAGNRFRFGPSDWRGMRGPAPGASVDFDAVEEAARDIYPAISSMGGLAASVDLEGLRSSEGAARLQALARKPEGLIVAISALALAAFLLPALSAPQVTTSLLDIGRIPALLAPADALVGGGEGLGATASLLWLRFLSPIAAATLIFMAFTGRRFGPAPLIAGVSAIIAGALPFVIKGAIISKVQTDALMGEMVGASLEALITVGPGAWLSLGAGAGLIAAGLGLVKNPLAATPL